MDTLMYYLRAFWIKERAKTALIFPTLPPFSLLPLGMSRMRGGIYRIAPSGVSCRICAGCMAVDERWGGRSLLRLWPHAGGRSIGWIYRPPVEHVAYGSGCGYRSPETVRFRSVALYTLLAFS